MAIGNIPTAQVQERWLYWTYQHREMLIRDLFTADGRSLKIIFPGFRNTTDGPDFFDAIIEIAGTRYSGDVEFHRAGEDWFRHGHHLDSRYRRVILHVLWENSRSDRCLQLLKFPHFSIRPHLKISIDQWKRRMEIFDAGSSGGASVCFPDNLNELALEKLAWKRFQRKADRIREWSRFFSFNDLLFITLAETLGYCHNQQPMRVLLWNSPPSKMYSLFGVCQRSPQLFWRYLLHSAGLKEVGSGSGRNSSDSRGAASRFADIPPVLKASDWRFRRVRPLNHPQLRLAALAFLVYRYQHPTLFETVLDLASRRLPFKKFMKTVSADFAQPYPVEFLHLLSKNRNVSSVPRNVMGRQRILQFLVNALFPLLYVWAGKTGNEGFRNYIGDIYFQCPACENSLHFRAINSAELNWRIKTKIQRFAAYQQGVLEFISVKSNGTTAA